MSRRDFRSPTRIARDTCPRMDYRRCFPRTWALFACSLFCKADLRAMQKNVYSVFRYYPPAVGFAQLSNPAALAQTQPPLTAPVVSTAIPTNVLTLGPGSQSLAGVTITSVEPFATGARSTTSNGNSAMSARMSRGISWPWAMGVLLGAVGLGLGIF